MTEVEWGSEGKEAPKPKKKVPGWMWFCGGGCLLALIAGIVMVVAGVLFTREAMDQPKQWDELRKVVGVDEPDPEGILIIDLSFTPGVENAWQLSGGDASQAVIMVFSGDVARTLKSEIGSGEGGDTIRATVGLLGSSEMSGGTTTLQGREFPTLRFTPENPGIVNPPTVVLDASAEGSDQAMLLIYKKVKSQESGISDEELASFFAPFHLGPDR
jgi:hypothetical protein